MPAARIDEPTPFEHWIQTKQLFHEGVTQTETFVTDGHEEGTRYAYGKCPEGWCFYIVMAPDEEPVFWQIYRDWLGQNPIECHHVTVVHTTKPANCGTPNTPPCEAIAGSTGALGATLPNASGDVKAA
jgi:hypothetical protein